MRTMLTLLLLGLLTACTTPNGLNSTAASTTAAVVGTAVGGPIVGVVAGGAAGVAADILTPSTTETETEVIETIPEEQRADVLKNRDIWMAIETLGVWIIVAFGAAWILPTPLSMLVNIFKKK